MERTIEERDGKSGVDLVIYENIPNKSFKVAL